MGLKIVLITTAQPACNPRIVKEADALALAGFDVTVVYSYFIKWASEKDSDLLKKVSWKYILAGGSPMEDPWTYIYTRIRNKFCRIMNMCGFQNGLIA